MVNILRHAGLIFKTAEDSQTIDRQIKSELSHIKRELASVTSVFNMTSDEDMIESLIYQMNGLSLRYDYLLKQAKERGLRSTAL